MSSIFVPEDILVNILLRLPFKSISLCRCVCKLWYTLLSNPSFVKTHYDLCFENNYPNTIFRCHVDGSKHGIYSMNISGSRCNMGTEIRYPFESKGRVEILGSSAGLLCILVGDQYFKESTICIWNPTTKEYKKIPKSPNNQFPCDLAPYGYKIAYGFCYDCEIEDFKLIKVVGFDGDSTRSGVQVYNLGSNSWKNTLEFTPYCFPRNTGRTGIIVHGSLHWLGRPGFVSYSRKSPEVIIYFNSCDDRFDELAFPAAVENEDVINEATLGVLDGCLCLLLRDPNWQVDLWVMRKYGDTESWSKLFTTYGLLVTYTFRNNFLVHSFENGELLFSNFDCFVLYNSRRDIAETLTIPGVFGLCVPESYLTSIFSLNSHTYAGQDDRMFT